MVIERARVNSTPVLGKDALVRLCVVKALSRQWSLDVQFDTRLNDQVIAGIQGVGP